jgi:hypothetical protein
MAPPRRPGLTIVMQKAPPDDPMAVLIFTAVPVEHCTPEMLAFRATAEPIRAEDNAWFSREGLPRSDSSDHLTIRHWHAGGVALFGYASAGGAHYAKELLDAVYIANSGRLAVRGPS